MTVAANPEAAQASSSNPAPHSKKGRNLVIVGVVVIVLLFLAAVAWFISGAIGKSSPTPSGVTTHANGSTGQVNSTPAVPPASDLASWATLLQQRYDECDGGLASLIFAPNAHLVLPSDGTIIDASAANYGSNCVPGATFEKGDVSVATSPAPTSSSFIAFITLNVGGQQSNVQVNFQKVGAEWRISYYTATNPGSGVNFSGS